MPTKLLSHKNPAKLEAKINAVLRSPPDGRRMLLQTVVAGASGELVAVLVDADFAAPTVQGVELTLEEDDPEPEPRKEAARIAVQPSANDDGRGGKRGKKPKKGSRAPSIGDGDKTKE